MSNDSYKKETAGFYNQPFLRCNTIDCESPPAQSVLQWTIVPSDGVRRAGFQNLYFRLRVNQVSSEELTESSHEFW